MKTSIFCLLAALGLTLQGCSSDEGHVLGYIEGRFTYEASPASGYLQTLAVHRGEPVKAGQLLYVLNAQPESQAFWQSEAQAAASQQQYIDMTLGQRPSEIKALEEEKVAAEATLVYAKQTLKRKQRLYKEGVLDESDLDRAKSDYLHDKAMVAEATAKIVTAKLGARIHQQNAQKDSARAASFAMKKSQWYLSKKTKRALKSGRVEKTFYREGEYVQAGQPVLSMLVPTEVKVVMFLPEPMLGKIKVGEKLSFACDGCKAGTATVDYIAAQAEYTPPVLYSQDARKDLVYRVEAAIPAATALSYHPGQPVDINLAIKKRAK